MRGVSNIHIDLFDLLLFAVFVCISVLIDNREKRKKMLERLKNSLYNSGYKENKITILEYKQSLKDSIHNKYSLGLIEGYASGFTAGFNGSFESGYKMGNEKLLDKIYDFAYETDNFDKLEIEVLIQYLEKYATEEK